MNQSKRNLFNLEISFRKLIVLALILIMSAGFLFPQKTDAAIAKLLNYQAKITDSAGDAVADSSYDAQFRICLTSDCSGGSDPVWSETWNTGTSQVTTLNGLFTVQLGTHTALNLDFNENTYYLGINFNSDGWMTPQKRISGAPYALNTNLYRGQDLAALTENFSISGDDTAARTITLGQTGSFDDILLVDAGNFSLSSVGNGIFYGDLVVGGNTATSSTVTNFTQNGDDLFVAGSMGVEADIYTDGDLYLSELTAGSVLFAGTNGKLTQDNANFFWNDSTNRLGLGTVTPNAKIEILGGEIYIWNNGANPRFLIGDAVSAGSYGGFRWDSANDVVQIGTQAGGYAFNLYETGRAGIGTATSGADAKFEVEIANASNVTGLLIDMDDSTNNPNALVITNAGTGYSIHVDQGDVLFDEDLYVGGGTPDLSSGFVPNGNDLFVAGSLGVESDIYTDGAIWIGNTSAMVLLEDAIYDVDNINFWANDDSGHYIYLNTTSALPGIYWEGITANDPGIRINGDNKLEYRNNNDETWTVFDDISGGSSLWTLGSFAAYRNDDIIVGADTSDTTPLTNTNFVMNGNDLFVNGMLGVSSSIYTEDTLTIDFISNNVWEAGLIINVGSNGALSNDGALLGSNTVITPHSADQSAIVGSMYSLADGLSSGNFSGEDIVGVMTYFDMLGSSSGYGMSNMLSHAGSGNIVGVNGLLTLSTGASGSVYGSNTQITNESSVADSAYGINIDYNDTGVVDNLYGLYMDLDASGVASESYGVRINASDSGKLDSFIKLTSSDSAGAGFSIDMYGSDSDVDLRFNLGSILGEPGSGMLALAPGGNISDDFFVFNEDASNGDQLLWFNTSAPSAPGIRVNTSNYTMEFRDSSNSYTWTAFGSGSGLWTAGTYSIYYSGDDVVVGADGSLSDTTPLTNQNFILSGNDLFVEGSLGVAEHIYTNGSFVAGSTLTLNDSYIRDSGDLNLQADNNSEDYIYLSTGTNVATHVVPAMLFAGIESYSNAPGFSINDSGQLVYRDEDSATWTPFDDLLSGGGPAGAWTDGGSYLYPTTGEYIGNNASAGSNKISGLYLGDSSNLGFGNDNDVLYNFSGSTLGVTFANNADLNFDSNTLFIDSSEDGLGIGTNSLSANDKLKIVLGANEKVYIDAYTTQHTGTDGVLDIDYLSNASLSAAIDINAVSAGISADNYPLGINVVGQSSSLDANSAQLFLYSAGLGANSTFGTNTNGVTGYLFLAADMGTGKFRGFEGATWGAAVQAFATHAGSGSLDGLNFGLSHSGSGSVSGGRISVDHSGSGNMYGLYVSPTANSGYSGELYASKYSVTNKSTSTNRFVGLDLSYTDDNTGTVANDFYGINMELDSSDLNGNATGMRIRSTDSGTLDSFISFESSGTSGATYGIDMNSASLSYDIRLNDGSIINGYNGIQLFANADIDNYTSFVAETNFGTEVTPVMYFNALSVGTPGFTVDDAGNLMYKDLNSGSGWEWATIESLAGGTSYWSKDGTNLSPATSGDDLLLNSGETLTLSDMTAGSMLFAGASGLVSQDNSYLYYDSANHKLGLGTNSLGNAVMEIETHDNTGLVALLLDNKDVNGSPNVLVINNAGTGYSILVDEGNVVFDNNLIVGGSTSLRTETLSNDNFSLSGDDLFVAGDLGVESGIYTDGSLVVGNTTTISDGSIVQSTTGDGSLVIQTTGGSNPFLGLIGSSQIWLGDNYNDFIKIDSRTDTQVVPLMIFGGVSSYSDSDSPSLSVNNNGQVVYKDALGSWTTLASLGGGSSLWTEGTHALYYGDDDVVIGGNIDQTIANGFAFTGNDLFVSGSLGIEENIYTDGDLYLQTDVTSAGTDIAINFGSFTPNEKLIWNGTSSYFSFSDDLVADSFITSDLTIENGSITQLTGSPLSIILGGAAGDDFIVDTSTLVVESDNNRVGIGDTTPDATLDVEVTGSSDGIIINNTNAGDGDSTLSFQLNNSTFITMGIDDSDGNKFKIATSDLDTQPILTIANGINKRIGVGTTTPSTSFHVTANSGNYNLGEGIIIENNSELNYNPFLAFSLSSVDTFTMGVDDADGDKFKIGTSAIGTNTRMTIDGSGNVGIGTTTPSAKLQVIDDSANSYAFYSSQNMSGSTGYIENVGAFIEGSSSSSGDADVTLYGIYASANQQASTTGTQVAYAGYFHASGSGTLWGVYVDEGDTFFADDTYVGSTSNTISNGSFALDGNDMYVQGLLGVEGGIFSDAGVSLAANNYINWGATLGSSGYGLRDNSGVMEYRDSTGSWTTFASMESLWTLGTYGTYRNDDVIIGGDIDETIANGFSLTGNDLFVSGMLGVEEDIYTDAEVYLQTDIDTTGAGDISLNFGGTNTETLKWLASGDYFEFSDDVVPSGNNTYSLGTDTVRWADAYLNSGSLHIGETTDEGTITYSTASNRMTFQNTDDSATGFYFMDADGGTPILNIDTTNERIGIGNSAPDVSLDVSSANATLTAINIDNTGTGDSALNLQIDSTTYWGIGTDRSDDGKLKFGVLGHDTGTKLTLSAVGQLGLGTASPSSLLDVYGSNPQITIDESGSGDPSLAFQLAGASKFVIGVDNDDGDKLKIGSGNPGTGTMMTIDANGYVVVGDTGSFGTSRLVSNTVSTSSTAGSFSGFLSKVSDTGDVSTGTDTSVAVASSVTRTGYSGGTINNYGFSSNITNAVGGTANTNNYGVYSYIFANGTTSGTTNSYAGYFTVTNAVSNANVYSVYANSGTMVSMDDLYVGATSESITSGSFSLDGDDFYVEGDAGINGNIYTDGSIYLGNNQATYALGSISTLSSLELLPSNVTDDHIIFKTGVEVDSEQVSAMYYAGIGSYTDNQAPGLSVDDNGSMVYRNANSGWTTFDSLNSGGEGYWSRSGSLTYLANSSDSINVGGTSAYQKLHVEGNIGIEADGYLNFGTTDGSSGYGFRDNSGVLEYRDSTGSWTAFGSGASVWTDAGTYVRPNTNGDDVRIYDSTGSDYWDLSHDGTNALLNFGGTTKLNVATDSLVVDVANKYVGIGTNSPTKNLHVYDNTTVPSSIIIENDGTGDSSIMYVLDGYEFAMGVDNSDSDKFKISRGSFLDSNVDFTIDSSGNVGIGTENPTNELHVSGTNSTADGTDGVYANIENISGVGNSMSGLRFKNSSYAGETRFKGGILYVDDGSGYGRGDLVFANDSTADDGNINTLDTKMIIKNDGSVGIGDRSPDAFVDIYNSGSSNSFRVDDEASDSTPFLIDESGNVVVGGTGTVGLDNPAKLEINVDAASTVGLNHYAQLTILTDTEALAANSDDNYGHYISVSKTGALAGSQSLTYGLYSNVVGDTGGVSYNYAGYFSATGADYNYAGIFENGSVGIGDYTPEALLDIYNSGTGDSFRVDDSIDGDSSPFVIDNDGNVGIGDPTPDAKLDITGYDDAVTTLMINNIGHMAGDGDVALYFQNESVTEFALGVDDSDGDKFKIGTTAIDTNTRLTIDANGNVGILDDSPDAVLDVYNAGAGNSFRVDNNDLLTSPFVVDERGFVGIMEDDPDSPLHVGFPVGKSVAFELTSLVGTTVASINSNGNLLLGAEKVNSEPSIAYEFEVDSITGPEIAFKNTVSSVLTGVDLATILFKGQDSGASSNLIGAKILATADGTWDGTSDNDAPTDLKFYTQNNGTDADLEYPRMTIDSTGYVSICGDACPAFGIIEGEGDLFVEDEFEVDGNSNIGGTMALGGFLTTTSGAIFNESSIDADFRVESDNVYTMFFVDGGSDRIGFGTNEPAGLLHAKANGDALFILHADQDASSNDDNPRLEFREGPTTGTIYGGVGVVGDAGDEFTDSIENAIYLESTKDTYGAVQLAVDGKAVLTVYETQVTIEGASTPLYVSGLIDVGNRIVVGDDDYNDNADGIGDIFADGNIEVDGYAWLGGPHDGTGSSSGNVIIGETTYRTSEYWTGVLGGLYVEDIVELDSVVGESEEGTRYNVAITADGKLIQGDSLSSSMRYKENIIDYDIDISKIMDLRPVTFNWKQEVKGMDGSEDFGLIAEEVADIFPEMVRYYEDQVEGVYYDKLSVILLKGYQEQQKQIEALVAQMATASPSEPINLGNSITADKWAIDENGVLVANVDVEGQTDSKDMYAMSSTEVEMTISGSSQLEAGAKIITFADVDLEFAKIVSGDVALKIIVTPTSECNGVYVAEKITQVISGNKQHAGFMVQELAGGSSDATFDWIVIGIRKGYENIIAEPTPEVPSEPIIEESTPTAPSEPIIEEPVPQEPVPSEPIIEEPVPQEPVPQEPAPSEPIIEEPVPEEPAPSEPAPEEPAPSEPTP